MKRLNKSYGAGVALAALALAGLSPKAEAITLQYLTGPLTGQSYSGGIRLVISGVSSGTTYGSFGATGTTVGSTTSASGITLMNNVPPGSVPAPVSGAGSNFLTEDTWGIGNVTQIFSTSGEVVWQNGYAPDNSQLTVMFYGGQDFWATQEAVNSQIFASKDLTIDLYERTPNALIGYGPGILPTDRIDLNSYPDFTEDEAGGPAFAFTKLASFESVDGFLRGPGSLGGLDTEVESNFVLSGAGTGSAKGYLNVVPGSGSATGLFNFDGWVSPFTGATADAFFDFATTVPAQNGWTTNISGPVQVIPEPTSALSGLACVAPILGMVLGRRRKVVA